MNIFDVQGKKRQTKCCPGDTYLERQWLEQPFNHTPNNSDIEIERRSKWPVGGEPSSIIHHTELKTRGITRSARNLVKSIDVRLVQILALRLLSKRTRVR